MVAEPEHVRSTAPLHGARRDQVRMFPAGTHGVLCGPWPGGGDGWQVLAVDDEHGPWHIPVDHHMWEETACD